MGCNIHGWIEVKHKYMHNYWSAQAREPIDNRNYQLFAYLANVRNRFEPEIVPISQPRGLPDDAAELTQEQSKIWNGDGHSHSWASAEEIISMRAILWFNDSWMDWLKIFKSYVRTHGKENVRFVFWFDN